MNNLQFTMYNSKLSFKKILHSSSGQALVTLIVFVAVATIIITAAVATTVTNSISTSKYSLGEDALRVAEAGAENALLLILRDPNYTVTNGSVQVDPTHTATVTVAGTTSKTITSVGQVGNFIRKVQVEANNSVTLTVNSWNEID